MGLKHVTVFLSLAVCATVVGTASAGVTGQWESNGSLAASVGTDLQA